MKKILFICKLTTDKLSGVSKKLISQIDAFKSIGNKVSYLEISHDNIYYVTDKRCFVAHANKNKFILNLQILKLYIKILKREDDIDMVYIRKFFANPLYIKMLKKCKEKRIKTVEEIPTYPYDLEIEKGNRLDLKISLLIDKIYRKKLKKYLDYIVTLSNDEFIFGIKTIRIENGVDLKKIKPIDLKINKREINIIAVASMEYWQGYDRIINSIANYYEGIKENKIDIFFHLVGEGKAQNEWEKLARKRDIGKNIIFHGFLTGKELDKLYSKCQIAVAILGLFRKNLKFCSTLKVKEYFAKAIPFIYATPEPHIEECKYCYKVSDDETIFNIEEIIEFLFSISTKNICNDMRKIAEKYFCWEIQMEKIINELYN